MSSKTYVGVTALPRYVIRTQTGGRTYYYFCHKPFPKVRLPGELGSVLFTDTYAAALRATNLEEFTALRAAAMPEIRVRFGRGGQAFMTGFPSYAERVLPNISALPR
jgi:hypothetical protein